MERLDYFQIIHRYIPPDSWVYRVYLPHASMVAAKALHIARKLGVTAEQQRFIEEAAMLHDIGIVRVKDYALSSNGDITAPYICHAPAGREILEWEGLPAHALVAERHIGLGISKQEIERHHYPLPLRDMLPETLEEKIICWADLFFTKDPEKLWREKSLKKVERKVVRYGPRQAKMFREWRQLFEETASERN